MENKIELSGTRLVLHRIQVLFLLGMVALSIYVFLFVESGSDYPAEYQYKDNPATGALIGQKIYGDNWPFSIARGVLYCDGPGQNVVLVTANAVYALNGRARGAAAKRGYVDGNAIRLRGEKGRFTVGNIGLIIQRGLNMCR